MQYACAILSSVAFLAVQYFSTLSHKRHDFRGGAGVGWGVYVYWTQNACIDFLYKFCCWLLTNCSNTLRNIHTNARENITRTRAKRKSGYFFFSPFCTSTWVIFMKMIMANSHIYFRTVVLILYQQFFENRLSGSVPLLPLYTSIAP